MAKERDLKVRVDGGRVIGLGHIFRCLSLSAIAAPLFNRITFYLAQPEKSTAELITREGFKVVALEQSEGFFSYLGKKDVVLLDGYHFTEEYELGIKNKSCLLITIDDLQHRKFHADILINHTPGIIANNYDTAPGTKVFLGLKYALIRKEFLDAEPRKRAPESFSKGFICFGGADQENLTLHYYRYLRKSASIQQIHLIVGPSYTHLDQLKAATKEDTGVRIQQNIKANELVRLLKESDFALVSASTISIESMKTGIPLYLVQTVENQSRNYRYLLESGCAAKPEAISDYSFASGAKMLQNQAATFDGDVEENLKSIFENISCS